MHRLRPPAGLLRTLSVQAVRGKCSVQRCPPISSFSSAELDFLHQEVNKFDVDTRVELALTPPSSWFTDERFYRLDRASLFGNSSSQPWQFACVSSDVDSPGAFVTLTLSNGDPAIVVRGHDGVLRGFYNVCRHHAATVVNEEKGQFGQTDCMQCPYHGWEYRLDGRLQRAPYIGGIQGFRASQNGLVPLLVDEYGPLVFVSDSNSADETRLSTRLQHLTKKVEDLNLSYKHLQHVNTKSYSINCNFKVFVDNYLDGGYHVSVLHTGLASQLNLSSYSTEVFDVYSVQSVGGSAVQGEIESFEHGDIPPEDSDDFILGADFPERLGTSAVYAYIYPNLMVNRYGPWLDTNIVIPTGPTSCNVRFDYWIDSQYYNQLNHHKKTKYVERSLSASNQVQEEDIWICERVQTGLNSSAYDRGRYAPKLEFADHHFHRLLASDYAQALHRLENK